MRLETDSRGAVSGVEVQGPDGKRLMRCGGVVLAAGGFEANIEMRTRYLGPDWELAKVRGTRFNTGDGIRMALNPTGTGLALMPSRGMRRRHPSAICALATFIRNIRTRRMVAAGAHATWRCLSKDACPISRCCAIASQIRHFLPTLPTWKMPTPARVLE